MVLAYIILLMTGCTERQSGQLWETLQLCDKYYNEEDTTQHWPEALELAKKLVAETDDPAAWGEYFYQKSCYEITFGNEDSVQPNLDRARELYLKSNDKQGKAKILLTSAQYYGMIGQYDSMGVFAEKGLELAKDAQTRGQLFGELSSSYSFKGNMPEAVKAGKESLRLLEECKDTATYIITTGNVGIAYRRQDMNDSAMACYNKGLKMSLAYGDNSSTAFLYNNLCVLYAEIGRYDEALEYALRAEKYARMTDDLVETLSAVANVGEMYSRKNKPEKAAEILKDNFNDVIKLSFPPITLKYINSLLNAMRYSGKTDSIDYYLSIGKETAKLMPENSVSAIGIYEIEASLLFDKGEYKKSLDILESLAKTKEHIMAAPENKMLLRIAKCHAAMNDYKKAYEMTFTALNVTDSLRNIKAERELSEFTAKYKTKEKELEIAKLKEENLKRETEILYLVIVSTLVIATLFIILLVLLYKRKLHKKNEEIVMARKYIDGMESERSRLARELHDGVCNDLLSINFRLAMPDCSKEQIAKEIKQTHATLRNISHELMPPSFNHINLNEMLDGYIGMLTIPDTLHVKYESAGDSWDSIPSQTAYELYRITQEAVSNIVKHSGATEATVHLTRKGQNITLDIRDNGKGYNSKDDGNGIGIRTIHDRAGSIGATCEIKSSDNGTNITIKINLSQI